MRATQRAGSTEVMLATTVDITLDPIPMLVKLVLTILVPALAGMVHRVFGNSQYNKYIASAFPLCSSKTYSQLKHLDRLVFRTHFRSFYIECRKSARFGTVLNLLKHDHLGMALVEISEMVLTFNEKSN